MAASPAFAAASNGHHKLVRLLAAHAADLDAAPRSGPDAGQSPLWHAAYFNAVAVAEPTLPLWLRPRGQQVLAMVKWVGPQLPTLLAVTA